MAFEGFPPLIAAQLHYLLNHSPDSVKIEQVWSGNKYNPKILDRFSLVIPYCLDTIKWDVLYYSECPMAPPDVIFGPDDEDFHPCSSAALDGGLAAPVKKVFSEWNSEDSTRLLVLIQGLRDQYAIYQRRLVGQVDDDRLKFEISTILSREGIEMQLISGVDKPEEVKFSVHLMMDVNVNKMVVGCPWKHQQKIYLQVLYPVVRKYESTPSAPRLKLVSSSDLKTLFSVEDVKLTAWMDGMCLAEYLPHLEETLERQVLEAVSLINVRRSFIEALALFFGRPLEADTIFCRKATFLAASGTFGFLVHFFLSTQFPKQQPALMLQSFQHLNQAGVPIKSNLTDYPWSPRWEAARMAERLYEFLTDEALNFKKYCNEAHLQP